MTRSDAEDVSWDEDSEAYVTRFTSGRTPSVVVAETVTNVLEMDGRTLFEYVDPDALDELVRDAPRTTRVSFDVEGATVTVHGDGHIAVRPP
jgi:hypothetical protein